MKVKVGVMGSAGGPLPEEICELARRLGTEIARHNCILLTGACPGIPHESVLGAKGAGGLVIGISPALSLDEHRDRFKSPWQEYDVLIFTGSGLMGREIENIRSCDIVVIMAGRSGTLGEFAIAYDEAKLIGVLTGTDGIADHLEEIVGFIRKDTGGQIIYDSDPAQLMDKLLQAHEHRIRIGIAYRGPAPNP
jgi:hypothetical protein